MKVERLAVFLLGVRLVEAQKLKYLTGPSRRRGTTLHQLPTDVDDLKCKLGDEKLRGSRGDRYKGCQTRTMGNRGPAGTLCQKWTAQTPHEHNWIPANYENVGDHNYCRNPFQQDTIWCVTMDPLTRWDYCEPFVCGNGKVEGYAAEMCDDGNTINGDGCSSTCEIEDGFVCLIPEDEGEYVESVCKRCRNGIREGGEDCDDGNSDAYDGCDPYCNQEEGWYCRVMQCGCIDQANDGFCFKYGQDYPCDEGVETGRADCRPDVCGDGLKWNEERCDDGNLIDADGCSSNCEIELNFACEEDEDRKSRCYNCGNGHIDFGEECDDGNLEDEDGCSPTCLLEPGAEYEGPNGEVLGANFTCTYVESDRGEQVVATAAPTDVNDTDAPGDEATAAPDGGARRLITLRQVTRSTNCNKVRSFEEENAQTLALYGGVGAFGIFLCTFAVFEERKRRKNKLVVKSDEILIVGKDGRLKKINTFNAVLTLQMQLKRTIKKRRAAKEQEAKAKEQQEYMRKQAAMLQEKKWKRNMLDNQRAMGPNEDTENPEGAAGAWGNQDQI